METHRPPEGEQKTEPLPEAVVQLIKELNRLRKESLSKAQMRYLNAEMGLSVNNRAILERLMRGPLQLNDIDPVVLEYMRGTRAAYKKFDTEEPGQRDETKDPLDD